MINSRASVGVLVALLCGAATLVAAQTGPGVRVERLLDSPIITPSLHPSIGENIQGPSLIRVPDWVENRLGTYYLYFADHKGRYIRLAYADDLLGPWQIHPAGSLQIDESHFLTEPPEVSPSELEQLRSRRPAGDSSISHDLLTEVTTPHIASPDVHVDDANRRIVMYFHGLEGVGRQASRVARTSSLGPFRLARWGPTCPSVYNGRCRETRCTAAHHWHSA